MEEHPRYSFIIPVYNAQDFLSDCLDSILGQEFHDWEAILVDDGSRDNSLEILKRYEANDSRFIVISQRNQGCGPARNSGIDVARGEFLCFVDADDYIASDYLNQIDQAQENKDVVFFDAARVSKEGDLIGTYSQHRFDGLTIEDLVRVQLTGKMEWGAWIKCVRTSLVKENGILFPSCSNAEDAVFSFKVLSHAVSYRFIPKVLYFYVDHHVVSLSSMPFLNPWGDAVDLIKEYALNSSLYERYASSINALRLTASVVSIDRITRYAPKSERKSLITTVMNDLRSGLDFPYGIDTGHMMSKARFFVPFLKHGLHQPVALVSQIRKSLRGC